MAELSIGPLTDYLSDEELAELKKKLGKTSPRLEALDDGHAAVIAGRLDGDLLHELLDRLDAHDLACDIYLPFELDFHRVEIGDGVRVGSALALIEVLDEIKDDLMVGADASDEDDEDEEEEEEEDDGEDFYGGDEEEEDADDEGDEGEEEEEESDDDDDYGHDFDEHEAELRRMWKLVRSGAEASIDRKVPLYVVAD